ncbi:MAG: winged helix DNA-binding domain-containing protein [Elusimicrobia bacterium]|nr:winged helix DNA-binding domain-containing protein [Elusimicrobiota bacterium]
MTTEKLRRLRSYAIANSLFKPVTLQAAIRRLGFVQADPIRAPARAQDLILRHRVRGYRAGDLERRYPALDIEEDYLYAYGFVSRETWRLLHPRQAAELNALERKILEKVRETGETHPAQLEKHFGSRRVINAWGGNSKATTHALDNLHYRGFLRIARRENGIRIYAAATPRSEQLPPAERLRKRVLAVVNILAPVPEKTLQTLTAPLLRRSFPGFGGACAVLSGMVRTGELREETADGLNYFLPPVKMPALAAPGRVRFLAPFDPLVWDRRRFEHFWKWPYRFEAYTPSAKRLRGYYAMPLLWGDSVIGWANARVAGKRLNVELGFIAKRPGDKNFRSELESEIGRLETFLNLRAEAG